MSWQDGGEREDVKESSAYMQAKDEMKKACEGLSAAECIKRMHAVQASKLEAEDLMKRVNGEFDALRLEIVPSRMEDEGLENMKIAGIGRVSLTADLLVSTKKGAKELLYRWLRKHDLTDLIQENVNASTLKSFVKNRMKEGKEVPDEFLNVTPITRANITKG